MVAVGVVGGVAVGGVILGLLSLGGIGKVGGGGLEEVV